MLLALICVLLAVLLFLRWLWSRREWYRMAWQMPGPIGLPLVGSAYRFLATEALDFIEECSLRFEHLQSPICIWLGTEPFVYIDTLDAVETVLTSSDCLDRQDSYKYIRQGLGVDGIFTLNGSKWKLHRRLVSPSFNYSVVLSYLPVFNVNCCHLVDGLQAKVDGGAFDVHDVLVPTMMNLFLEATFGSDLSQDDKQRFKKYMSE